MAIPTSHRAPLLRGRIISQRDARSGLDVGGSCRVPSPSWSDQSTATGSRCDRKIKPVTLRQNHTAADSIRRSWIFRYAKGGKEHQMGLGPVHTISLADARQEATELRKALYRGQDPLAQRNAARASAALETAKAVTFDKCCDAYVKAHSAGWRSAKHAAQWTSTLKTYADPVFGKIAVQAVDVALLMKALEPIWTTNPVTASRLRGRIEAVL